MIPLLDAVPRPSSEARKQHPTKPLLPSPHEVLLRQENHVRAKQHPRTWTTIAFLILMFTPHHSLCVCYIMLLYCHFLRLWMALVVYLGIFRTFFRHCVAFTGQLSQAKPRHLWPNIHGAFCTWLFRQFTAFNWHFSSINEYSIIVIVLYEDLFMYCIMDIFDVYWMRWFCITFYIIHKFQGSLV